jgi:hypothetical protein
VFKLDVQGQLIWEQTFGGSRDDSAHAIQIASDGAYVVAGHTESGRWFGKGNMWVFKFKPDDVRSK